jgi:transposase-like protein
MDPRGFPTSLPEFQKVFPDDTACKEYLENIRWPDGFACPICAHKGEPYRFGTRNSTVLRCRICKKNTSLTAGTVMQSSHTPLSTWFWAAYLVTTQTPGQSALQFQRQLGLSRYETAWAILHKLRAGMTRPDRDTIGGEYPVEVDECLVGGKTRGKGRGVHDMTNVIAAVEVRLTKEGEDRVATRGGKHKDGKPLKRKIYAGRLRLRVIPNRSTLTCTQFVVDNVTAKSVVRTDAFNGYSPLKSLGYIHESMALNGDPEKADAHLPMVHLVISNLKTWIMGTHHGAIAHYHLQAYLNEYQYRFNRRFYPMTAFNSVLGIAAHSISPTYDQLYSGVYPHAA